MDVFSGRFGLGKPEVQPKGETVSDLAVEMKKKKYCYVYRNCLTSTLFLNATTVKEVSL